jgi:hypothetical protein
MLAKDLVSSSFVRAEETSIAGGQEAGFNTEGSLRLLFSVQLAASHGLQSQSSKTKQHHYQ